MKKYFFLIAILVSGLVYNYYSRVSLDEVVDKHKIIGYDYRLFQGTPYWNLAKAIYYDDLTAIDQIIKTDTLNINYQEPIWGGTLLRFAVHSQKYEVSKLLLDLGANPNIHDFRNGESVITEAVDDKILIGDKTKFLKLLLKYGANPNDEEAVMPDNKTSMRYSALAKACTNNLEIVKLLVEAGANINYTNETIMSPLFEAVSQKKYDIVLYLLEKGADPNQVLVTRPNGMQLRLIDFLKEDEDEVTFSWQKTEFNKVKAYLVSKGTQ